MADNPTITSQVTSETDNISVAADDIGGVQYQRVKIALGADGAYDTDVDSGQQAMANSVPVVIASDQSGVAFDNADTSAIGTNSDTVISGGNWSSDTYTGSGEQNDYQYAATSLQTDEAGTLFYDFSVDGTNWSTFPVAGFAIASGIHEYHSAHKGGRYFRPRFVGSGGRSYFRLYTYYTNSRVRLNSPLNFSMTADTDGEVVKSAHEVQYTPTPSSVTEGSFDVPSITRHKEVRTRDQRALKLQRCDDSTEFTVLSDDAANLADAANHIYGTAAVTFDKVNGTANTGFAGIQDTIAEVDGQEIFEMGSFVGMNLYLPSVSNVVAAQLRIGTDSSNYNEWEWSVDSFTAAQWLPLRMSTAQPSAYAGNGWNPAAITYVAAVVEFSAETDTLAGIIVDNIYMVGGRVTDSTTDASVSTSISSPNINVHKVGNKNVDTNTGNSSAGTQRVVLASDQPSVTVDAANDGSLNVQIGDGSNSATIRNLSSNDALNVAIVDGAGNQVTSFGGSGGTSATDDAVFTAGSGSGTPMMAFATSDTVDSGDVGVLAMDTSRNLKVSIEADNAGIGGGTQYTEDEAAVANPVGSAVALVRQDTPATLTSADGDIVVQRATNYGAGFVQVVDSSGNFVDSFGGSGGTSSADDADFAAGATQGTPVMGVYESSPSSVTDGDLGVVGIDQNRNIKVSVAAQMADVTIADGGNSITVDGTLSINGSAAEDTVAPDPVVVGGRYHASVVGGDDVDDGDATKLMTDSVGGVIKGHRDDSIHSVGEYTTAQSATSIQAAPGAGLRFYITDIVLSTDTAMTMSLDSGATQVAPNKYFAANGGMSAHLQTPIACPVNTSLTFTSSAAGNHSVQVGGYIAP